MWTLRLTELDPKTSVTAKKHLTGNNGVGTSHPIVAEEVTNEPDLVEKCGKLISNDGRENRRQSIASYAWGAKDKVRVTRNEKRTLTLKDNLKCSATATETWFPYMD
ncbi:unnamed protein product [Sphenostylis stenocarpa]|uniref:Uncharacterized protein n=1 Tax=Sphenostylis stenocarpa TaxID=92480 RepID=A0AA86RYP5_9FABA|nr:unnamed protein product [Sphenostylis stenocarpa]